MIETARIFKNGRSQAVRLPKSCRFKGKEVYVHKVAHAVMLFEKDDPWAPLVDSLDKFTPDFMEERNQPPQQHRKVQL